VAENLKLGGSPTQPALMGAKEVLIGQKKESELPRHALTALHYVKIINDIIKYRMSPTSKLNMSKSYTAVRKYGIPLVTVRATPPPRLCSDQTTQETRQGAMQWEMTTCDPFMDWADPTGTQKKWAYFLSPGLPTYNTGSLPLSPVASHTNFLTIISFELFKAILRIKYFSLDEGHL
jgi:hypothetical protein